MTKKPLLSMILLGFIVALSACGGKEDPTPTPTPTPTPDPDPVVKATQIINYQTTDGKTINVKSEFGNASLQSNTYENGKGTLTFDKDVEQIPENAFAGFTTLSSVSLPSNVTSIGNRAFDGCTAMTTVSIPSKVNKLGINPFRSCSGLRSFSGQFATSDGKALVAPKSATKADDDKVLVSFAPAGTTSYTIPEDVDEIGQEAFYDCDDLTDVVIPEEISQIDDKAFYDCDNLSNMHFEGEEPPTVASDALQGTPSDMTVHVPAGSEDAYASAEGGLENVADENIVSDGGPEPARKYLRCVHNEDYSGAYRIGYDASKRVVGIILTGEDEFQQFTIDYDKKTISAGDMIGLTFELNADGMISSMVYHGDDETQTINLNYSDGHIAGYVVPEEGQDDPETGVFTWENGNLVQFERNYMTYGDQVNVTGIMLISYLDFLTPLECFTNLFGTATANLPTSYRYGNYSGFSMEWTLDEEGWPVSLMADDETLFFEWGDGTNVEPSSVTVEFEDTQIDTGEHTEAMLSMTPAEAWAEVKWSSSDPSVATVNNLGRVTGVSEGRATITATAGGHTGSAQIKVVKLSEDGTNEGFERGDEFDMD